MRKKRRTAMLFAAAIMAVTATAGALLFTPVKAEETTDTATVYIRGQEDPYAFLYEADGTLRYGTPVKADEKYEWVVEYGAEKKTIRNAKTGRYITLKNYESAGIFCADYEENNDDFLWSFDVGDKQNIISESSAHANFAVNIEYSVNGVVDARAASRNELAKGNMTWNFLEERAVNFASLKRNGFGIRNADGTAWLYDNGGSLAFGTSATENNAYIWEIEQTASGKLIRNKKSGEYISEGGLSDEKSEGLAFDFEITDGTKISCGSAGVSNLLMYEQGGNVHFGADVPAGGDGKWTIVSAAYVNDGDVMEDLTFDGNTKYNLKNTWQDLYLIEENGTIVYGNTNPSNEYAQWYVRYDEASGNTALINVATGHYVRSDSAASATQQTMICDDEETYFFKLLRNQTTLYPDASVFRQATSSANYLHIEKLTGFAEVSDGAQPTWGSPHWEIIEAETNSVLSDFGSAVTVPEEFIRLESEYDRGSYLFESASGAMAYGTKKESDASSHWAFLKAETAGDYYYLVNRKTGNYAVNIGTGIIRFYAKEKATQEGSLWTVTSGGKAGTFLIGNVLGGNKANLQPYLNNESLSGIAQSILIANDKKSAHWICRTAGEVQEDGAAATEILAPLNVLKDTNDYRVLKDGATLDGTYRVEYFGNNARIVHCETGKYLYADNNRLKERASTNRNDSKMLWSKSEVLGEYLMKSGGVTLSLEKTAGYSVYPASETQTINGKTLFTVYAENTDVYNVDVTTLSEYVDALVYVNGALVETTKSPVVDLKLTLNRGINTIGIAGDDKLLSIAVADSVNKNYNGASVTYTTYELEDAETTGTILEQDRTYRTYASEASGRSAVQLDKTGQYVKFTLKKATNALVLRAAIPDAEKGGGVGEYINLYMNGVKTERVLFSSKQSWLYGEYPWSNDPTKGNAHMFYCETRLLLKQTYPAGTELKLQKDMNCYSARYILDLVETELVDNPYEKPDNALSVMSFGAVPNDGKDDKSAFNACIEAAAKLGYEVYIPAGVFNITSPESGATVTTVKFPYDNMVIRGAGMWHTVIEGGPSFVVSGNNVEFYDFAMNGVDTTRDDNRPSNAIARTGTPSGLVAQNLWIERYKCGFWFTTGDHYRIVGNRVRNLFADGINFQSSVTDSIVSECDFRYTGDDAIAQWSEKGKDTNNAITYNTVAIPWLANGIVVYGGKDITIADNLVKDTIYAGGGINVSTDFNPRFFAGTIAVERNVLVRCGSQKALDSFAEVMNLGAIWINTLEGNNNHAVVLVKDNVILDSTHTGISINGDGVTSRVVLEGNLIDTTETYGVQIYEGAVGRAVSVNNVIVNTMLDEYKNDASTQFELTFYNKEVKTEYDYVEIPRETITTYSNEKPAAYTVVIAVAGVAILAEVAAITIVLIRRKREK